MVNFNPPTPPQPSFYPTQTYRADPEDPKPQLRVRLPPNMKGLPPALLHSREANMRRLYSNGHARIDYSEDESEHSSQQNSLTSFWKTWFQGVSNFFKGCFRSSREVTIDTDLEMERERYRYIRETHAQLDNVNGMSVEGERGSSAPADRDFPAEIMESLEGSPVVSYGTSVPPVEDIEDTSEAFALSKREFNRMVEQKGASVNTQESHPGFEVIKNGPLHDRNTQDEDTDAQVMKFRVVPSLPEEWNSCNAIEAPLFEKKKVGACSGSKPVPQTVMEHPIQEIMAEPRDCGSKGGDRIRFSSREKRASTRRAKAEDPILNYRWGESPMEERMEELTTCMTEDVNKLQKMLDSDSTYRQNLADLGRDEFGGGGRTGEKVRFVEEVESFVDDVTKAAEDMARTTKRRSDLFLERIRMLELGDVPKQEVEFESLLRKVAECEKHNAELRDRLTRAKERYSSPAVEGGVARGCEEE